jgi:ribosome-associated protein
MKEFSLKGHEYVELKNLLKLLDLVNSGGEAKVIIQSGEVMVNGEVETRRGRKLKPGDNVTFNGTEVKIIS